MMRRHRGRRPLPLTTHKADYTFRCEIPDGPAGTRETLKQMRQLVQIGRGDEQIRALSLGVINECEGKDWDCELRAIFNFVRSTIRYTLDPNDIELLQSPTQTLILRHGDCDDMSTLLATMLEAVGHRCVFMALGFGPIGEYSHVLVGCFPAAGEFMVSLDATEDEPMGWFPPGVTCQMIAQI